VCSLWCIVLQCVLCVCVQFVPCLQCVQCVCVCAARAEGLYNVCCVRSEFALKYLMIWRPAICHVGLLFLRQVPGEV
jgi:hypothetical protein